MHILWSLALILGALAILVMGLVGVVHDLLQRGPYEPPLIRNDGLAWPARYQGSSAANLQPAHSESRFAGAAWSARGSNRH
jgi:hypothetical protein